MFLNFCCTLFSLQGSIIDHSRQYVMSRNAQGQHMHFARTKIDRQLFGIFTLLVVDEGSRDNSHFYLSSEKIFLLGQTNVSLEYNSLSLGVY